MADEILKRDQNHRTVSAAVTNDADLDISMLRVDPVTGYLLIQLTNATNPTTASSAIASRDQNHRTVCMGWDAVCNRVCTYGLFKNKKNNQVVWVFNTHFDHVGKTARIESAKLILKKIKELNVKNDPVILLGDFNLRPTEEPIQKIASEMNNARDISKMIYGNIDTWNAFKFKEKPNGGIDYIFVNKHQKLVVEKFATITDSYDLKYPSDHFPVMATITLLK